MTTTKRTKMLGSRSQDIDNTKIGLNRKVFGIENDELEIKPNTKAKTNIKQEVEKPKIDEECPSCKQRNWLEFDTGNFVKIVLFFNKRKRQIASDTCI